MDDVTALRDALLATLYGRGGFWVERDDVRKSLDALIAAEARAALTPERLAKALDAVPWEPVRDPLDMVTYQEAAAQLLAALATDEPVP